MMKILIFIAIIPLLLIPQIAYGSEIFAEPEKALFGPNEWIQISIHIDGYSGGDVKWIATQPDGTQLDGIFSNLKASKTTHSIIRNAFDGQFGTWIIQYEYNDTVKIIGVEVEPLVVSVTTDQLSYVPGGVATVQFSTNFFNPSASIAETMTIEILDDKGVSTQFSDKIKIKVTQPIIVQTFSIDQLLLHNPFGVFHAVVNYYNVQVDVPFEIVNPSSKTSIFLSSNKKLYSPNDPVELNIIMPNISLDSGLLSITSPSGQLFTKIIPITNSLTRVVLDDFDTSQVGLYLIKFEYGSSNASDSFEVYDETQKSSSKSNLEMDITLNKPQYRPGETIQATINVNELVDDQIVYWFEDSQMNQGQQFSFVNPASGTFTIPHILSVDFLQGPSKLHVKFGSVETFAIFFVAGEAVTPSEKIITDKYDGPEILLTIDDRLVNFSQISDISISPNLELFVVDSGDSKIKVFDIKGNLRKTWEPIGNDEIELNNPVSILAEESLVHVSDAGNSRIVTFDNNGNFIRDWGNSGITYKSIQNPTDIAIDGSGIYYISDGNKNKILKYDENGTYVGEITSLLTAAAKFSSIDSITANEDDDIFLLSTKNNRILHFHSNGGFLKSFGTEGQNNKQFRNPTSLQFTDNDYLYVADSGNNRVLVLNTNGDFVAKWGTFGNGSGQFNTITGIDVDPNGNIWVADSGNNRIQKFASLSGMSPIVIPDWIRNNAKWWIENQITDNDFATGIEYMIKEKIIVIPELISFSDSSNMNIPDWVKNTTQWWAERLVSDEEFANTVEYLIKIGIIKV